MLRESTPSGVVPTNAVGPAAVVRSDAVVRLDAGWRGCAVGSAAATWSGGAVSSDVGQLEVAQTEAISRDVALRTHRPCLRSSQENCAQKRLTVACSKKSCARRKSRNTDAFGFILGSLARRFLCRSFTYQSVRGRGTRSSATRSSADGVRRGELGLIFREPLRQTASFGVVLAVPGTISAASSRPRRARRERVPSSVASWAKMHAFFAPAASAASSAEDSSLGYSSSSGGGHVVERDTVDTFVKAAFANIVLAPGHFGHGPARFGQSSLRHIDSPRRGRANALSLRGKALGRTQEWIPTTKECV